MSALAVESRSDGIDGRFYLARRDGVPVGVLHVTPDGRDAVIEHIYVLASARRGGVGAALVASARATGYRQLRHDGRLSPSGAALLDALGVRARRGCAAQDLDAQVTEDTGRALLDRLTAAMAADQ